MFNHNAARDVKGRIRNLSNRRSTARRQARAAERTKVMTEALVKRPDRPGLLDTIAWETSKPKVISAKKPPTKTAPAYSLRNSQTVLLAKFGRHRG